MKFSEYKTVAFDCDGVILNSNKIKTEAFYRAALPYGKNAAEKLVSHHIERGGVSRFNKFKWFLDTCVKCAGPNIDQLLESYAAHVREKLLTCDIAPSIRELRHKNPLQKWLVVSGGAELELKEIFSKRGIYHLFDAGIFGSPDDKIAIFNRELTKGNILRPAIFLGDSKFDFEAADRFGIDFNFITQWTEVADWKEFCHENRILSYDNISHYL